MLYFLHVHFLNLHRGVLGADERSVSTGRICPIANSTHLAASTLMLHQLQQNIIVFD